MARMNGYGCGGVGRAAGVSLSQRVGTHSRSMITGPLRHADLLAGRAKILLRARVREVL
jgi:hypothetical protein